jgi:hypothetical protein
VGNEKIVIAEEGHSLTKELGLVGYHEILETDPRKFEEILSSLTLSIITRYQNAMIKF